MGKKRKGDNIKCKACEKEFYVPQYRIEKAKFCSLECLNHVQYEKTILVCRNCEKDFTVSESRKDRIYCSFECAHSKQTTEREYRAKIKALGILKRGRNNARNIKKYLTKIRKMFCDNCGYDKASYNIEIHHIDNNPNNNTLDNLAVLCVMCHRDLHHGNLRFKDNKYYYENNND